MIKLDSLEDLKSLIDEGDAFLTDIDLDKSTMTLIFDNIKVLQVEASIDNDRGLRLDIV